MTVIHPRYCGSSPQCDRVTALNLQTAAAVDHSRTTLWRRVLCRGLGRRFDIAVFWIKKKKICARTPMKMLRCPLDGFHLQRGRGQTFCNPGREMNRGPVQSPSVAWSFQQNPKAQLAFSSWFHVYLIFLPVSTTLMELGVFELQSGAETPKGLSGGKVNLVFLPLWDVTVMPCVISHPSETLLPPVPVIFRSDTPRPLSSV